MRFVENVIPALENFLEERARICLATLARIEGSAPRPVGSQIGVAEDGRHAGMITGGCAEQAIVAEAQRCIEQDENKLVRYGEGSPYLDVKLPCGSGIDVYFETKSAAEIVRAVAAAQVQRKIVRMAIDVPALASSMIVGDESPDALVKVFEPDFQLFAFGEGANLISVCHAARASNFSINAFTPHRETFAYLIDNGFDVSHIHHKTEFNLLPFDAFSGVVTLFHEHEWEQNILRAALDSGAPYIGAIGSRKTHAARLEALAAATPTQRPASIIHGPVGLDIGAQNPDEIATSIMAEIIAVRRKSIS